MIVKNGNLSGKLIDCSEDPRDIFGFTKIGDSVFRFEIIGAVNDQIRCFSEKKGVTCELHESW